MNPTDSVLAITYKCNARCVMCDIWQLKDFPELSIEDYRKLPSSLRDINISGGEPFMRSDLPEVIRVIKETCPKAHLIISTNGFAPEIIAKKMPEILKIDPNIGVAISVDGVGDKHEEIRRIPDSYGKVIKTLKVLQDLGMTNLRFAFTILPQNISHFSKVYDEAKKYGIEFTSAFAQSSDHYFGGKKIENHPNAIELKKQFTYVIGQELKSWNLKRWARAYFAFGLYKFGTEQEQVLSNDPGNKFFFMDPAGVVYPSVVHNYIMGDLSEVEKWEDLWQGEKANDAREMLKKHGQPAWMICTARTAIKSRPIKVGLWVLKNKFFGVKLK